MREPVYWIMLQQALCRFLGNLFLHSPTFPLPVANSFETLGQLQPHWKLGMG